MSVVWLVRVGSRNGNPCLVLSYSTNNGLTAEILIIPADESDTRLVLVVNSQDRHAGADNVRQRRLRYRSDPTRRTTAYEAKEPSVDGKIIFISSSTRSITIRRVKVRRR